jgi:hypothetical protein
MEQKARWNMGRQRITIGQNEFPAWGKLVKTWATGKNYVDHVMVEENPVPTTVEMPPKFPKPRSFTEFFDQCFAAHVGLIFDDGLDTPVQRDEGIGLIVIQGDTDVFILRVPPLETLLEREAKIIAGKAYPLPAFYETIFEVPPVPGEMDTKVKRMTIHAERIGDYTLNTCG